MKHHDWRLLPVAVAAWGASFIASSGWRPEPQAVGAMLVGLVLLALLAHRANRAWVAVIILVVVVTALTAGLRSWQRHSGPVADLAAAGAVGLVELRLTTEAVPRSDVIVAPAELAWVEARGSRVLAAVPVVVLASGELGQRLLTLEPGAGYRVRGRLGEPRPDEAVAAVLSLREVVGRTSSPSWLNAVANQMRSGLRSAVSHSPPQQAALVPSLVVGDTSRVDDAMRADFQATGLTHLMAVSGANLTLLLGVLLATARAVGVRGWWVRIVALLGVGFFVLVCGQEPSVLRATAMGIVALAATGVGPGNRSVRALCLAVTVLVWCDPWLSRSVGFALSVTACAGIVLLGPVLRDSLTRWCPRWIAEAFAVSLAAQLATQPIVTAISDRVSVVGVGTNVLAAPFVGPTTVLGLLAAVLSPLGEFAVMPGWLAGWCAQPILWISQAGAALPASTWEWPASPTSVAAVAVASAALAAALVWVLRSWLGGFAFVAVLLAASLVRPVPLGWPGEWAVAFCDVGQGDATAIRAGPGAAVLVDAGPEPGPTLECLSGLGVDEVPMLVLTHYHADHTGGAAEVIERFRPRLVLVRSGEPPRWLVDAVGGAGGEVRSAVEGERLRIGEAEWSTASVPDAPGPVREEGEGSAENDASVVGVAESVGLRVLLAGDAEPPAQLEAMRSATEVGVSLEAQILKLPHHGSSRQERRFFAATGAALAVASSGEGNDYGHPAKAAIDLAEGLGMTVARTDRQGTVLVARGETALGVVTRR